MEDSSLEAGARLAIDDASVRAAIDETRRPWWRREQSHGDALPEVVAPDEILTSVHFPVWDGRCGFGVAEFRRVGELIVETLDGLARTGEAGNSAVEGSVKQRVHELTRRFPIYS